MNLVSHDPNLVGVFVGMTGSRKSDPTLWEETVAKVWWSRDLRGKVGSGRDKEHAHRVWPLGVVAPCGRGKPPFSGRDRVRRN